MPKNSSSKYGTPDSESPEWTAATFATAKRREGLPVELDRLLPRRRGSGKKPAKVSLTLRLSPQVVEAFRATGAGWQTRMRQTLERAAKRLAPAGSK